LIKGPIAPLILLLTAVLVGVRYRDRAWVGALRPASGFAILAAMVAPWLFAINASTEGRFFAEALGRDMVGKIGAAQESHAGPPGFHLALAPLLLWPAMAMLPAALMDAFRERRAWPFLLLISWAVPSWIVFELTATKLPHYVLPLYPALCLLAAQAALSHSIATRPTARRAGAAIYAVVGLVFAAALAVLPAFYASDRTAPSASIVASVVIGIGAIGVATLFWAGRTQRASFAAVALSAAFAWALLNLTPPHLQRLDVSRTVSEALDAAGFHPLRDSAPPVALAGYREPSVIFLLGTDTFLGDGAAAAERLAALPRSAAVVEAQEDAQFMAAAAALGLAPRRLAVIDGVNYSKGDTVRLTLYAIAR
jgi:4-amino-4-deoxy-L-arabinose transferase-like glycosyltransferase